MDHLLVTLSILLALVAVWHLFKARRNPFEAHGLPYKSSVPLLGSTWEWILGRKCLATVVQEIYNMAPDARYVGLYNRMTPVLMIRDRRLIKSIAITNFHHFPNHRNFGDQRVDPIFSSNLLSLRDNRWKEVRSSFTPVFSSSKMRSMFRLMSESAVNVARYLSTLPANENVVEMKDIFTRYANDVFATCAFGIAIDSLADRDNRFYKLGREVLDIHSVGILKLVALWLFPRLAKKFGVTLLSGKTTGFFKNLVSENIRTREEKGIVRPDFIQLMTERKKSRDLSVDDITAQAFAFFFGGFETTSGLLCFAVHELAANPQIQQRLHAEIDAALADCQHGEITLERLDSLEYLDAVVNETLRMYPVIPFTDRECSIPFELPAALPATEPYVMERGSHLWLPIYAIQRDPRYFEKPDCFQPDRFLDRGSNLASNGAYLPFGVGPRNCIGKRFTLIEAKVALFHVLARCRLQVCPKTTVPMELKTSGVFLTAKNGFWLRVDHRAA